MTLNCSSPETALASVSDLIGLPSDAFRRKLLKVALNWSHQTVPPEDQLVQALGYGGERDLPTPSAIRWFHATRAPIGTTFEEGLLPTTEALPKLWHSVATVAMQQQSEEDWAAYQLSFDREDRHFSAQFHQKAIAPGWEGPFAFLVRDAALGRCGRHKNFTTICETLEDICADYEDATGYQLRAAYEAATRGCLVVFTRPGNWPGAVRAALNYLHRSLRNEEQSLACNINYAGHGVTVPHAWIDEIEWLDRKSVV